MSRFYFDLETDGLLNEVSVIHSLVMDDLDTREVYSFHEPEDIQRGLQMLADADEIVGHNIIGYDIPVIRKLYPGWKTRAKVTDTILLTKLLYGDMKDRDFGVRNSQLAAGLAPSMPGQLIGRQSLESWGWRLGEMKGEYTTWCKEQGIEDPWKHWRPEMQAYCEQDVRVTRKLHEMLCRKHDLANEWARAIDLEHRFANLIQLQEVHGFRFDEEAAAKLERALRERHAEEKDGLTTLFPPWIAPLTSKVDGKRADKLFVPSEKANLTTWVTDEEHGGLTRVVKEETGETYVHRFKTGSEQVRKVKREVTRRGYMQSVSPLGFARVEYRVFNPASRHHVADRLQKLYGWKPTEFGADGVPTIDDDILSSLPYPPAKALAVFYMIEKRLGFLADGKKAVYQYVRNGRVHGRVNTLGAVTHRCTHSDPNMAQNPSIENAKGIVPYGAEFRALWLPDIGHVLVGCDGDSLELRCLAHFLLDGGRYTQIVDEGNKDDGTDIHTVNQKAAGLLSRARAKRFIYAFLYGSGDELLGMIAEPDADPKDWRKIGRRLKKKFLDNTPGLKGLIEGVKAAAKKNGWIRGIDGRRIPIRYEHAALNSLLQNAGAVAMKLSAVLLYEILTGESLAYGMPRIATSAGDDKCSLKWGIDWAQVAHVHDEAQITSKPEHAKTVERFAVWSIEEAGRLLNFKCPLRGNAASGANWKETH